MKAVLVSAFTLIELLVVIVIIGILSMMVAPDYLRFKQKIDLKDSTSLLQTGFQEAYSLARSRSRHFRVTGTQGDDFFQVWECDDFSDGDGYNCSTSTVVPSPSGGTTYDLEGQTILSSDTFEVHFYAPQGDMNIVTPSSDPLIVELDNDGLLSNLALHPQSGLITPDTP